MLTFRLPAICIMAVILCISGCSGKQVRVSSQAEFSVMAQRLAPLLRDRGIIDAQGAYLDPLFGSASLPQQFGEYLFQRLSPAFRFQVDPSLLPATFAASKTSEGSVEFRSGGFVLEQGLERITVSLLAEADWNDDTHPDWLLLCRVASLEGYGLRDYYLVLQKTDDPVLRPRLIAVYDCLSRTCKLFVTTTASDNIQGYNPELPVVDVEAGQGNITVPPGTDLPNTDQKSTLHEQKISG